MTGRSRYFFILALPIAGLAAGCFSEASGNVGSGADAGKAAPCLTPEDSERFADQVVQLINLERAAEGLTPVADNSLLTKTAEEYACRMVEDGFFDHRDPLNGDGPGERAISQKYAFFAVGENLAAGQETPAEVVNVWMESPSHRAIILDAKWEEVGAAVRSGGVYSIYWVLEFGQPAGR